MTLPMKASASSREVGSLAASLSPTPVSWCPEAGDARAPRDAGGSVGALRPASSGLPPPEQDASTSGASTSIPYPRMTRAHVTIGHLASPKTAPIL